MLTTIFGRFCGDGGNMILSYAGPMTKKPKLETKRKIVLKSIFITYLCFVKFH